MDESGVPYDDIDFINTLITQATTKDQRRTVMCFSRADGKLLWQSGVTYEQHEPTNAQNPY